MNFVTEKLDLREIKYSDHREAILKLREEVWREEDFPLKDQIFISGFEDEYDQQGWHWAVFDHQNRLLASARLSVHHSLESLPDFHMLAQYPPVEIKDPMASLNRLVVSNEARGKGISYELDKIRMDKARDLACTSICVTSHGNRFFKLMNDGFEVFDIIKSSKDIMPTPSVRFAFFYKEL